MAAGRTDEQKRACLQALTAAAHEAIGAPVASIPGVVRHEFPPENFIAGGEVMADHLAAGRAAEQLVKDLLLDFGGVLLLTPFELARRGRALARPAAG